MKCNGMRGILISCWKVSFYVGWLAWFPQPNIGVNPIELQTAQPNLRLIDKSHGISHKTPYSEAAAAFFSAWRCFLLISIKAALYKRKSY